MHNNDIYSSNCSINFSNSSLAWGAGDFPGETGDFPGVTGDLPGVTGDLPGVTGDFGTAGGLAGEDGADNLPVFWLADKRCGDVVLFVFWATGDGEEALEFGDWIADDDPLAGTDGLPDGTAPGDGTWMDGKGLLLLLCCCCGFCCCCCCWGAWGCGLLFWVAVISNIAHFSDLVTYSCSINGIWSLILTSSLPGNAFLGLFESHNY